MRRTTPRRRLEDLERATTNYALRLCLRVQTREGYTGKRSWIIPGRAITDPDEVLAFEEFLRQNHPEELPEDLL